jgi:hypothetical protein
MSWDPNEYPPPPAPRPTPTPATPPIGPGGPPPPPPPPRSPAPPPWAPTYASQPPARPPKQPTGKGFIIAGAIVLIAGLAAGLALVLVRDQVEKETVKDFARAPVGCTTSLEFDDTGEFVVYIETKGSTPDLGGDCDATGGEYERTDDDLPRVSLTLVDADGNELDLDSADGPSYDTGDYAGVATSTVQIDDAGTYRLTVTSDDADFAIAVGGDAAEDADGVAAMGVGLIAIGLAVGVPLLVVGLVRRRRWRTATAGASP